MQTQIRAILFCSFIALCLSSIAQEKKKKEGDVTDVVKITFLNPGISYEKRIGKFQTLYVQGFMNTSMLSYYDYYSLERTYKFFFDPAISVQYRYYYNYQNRTAKDKRTSFNSLNYIAPVYEGIFTQIPVNTKTSSEISEKRRMVNRVGLLWGFQRNYPERFSLDLNLGYGIMFASTSFPDGLGKMYTVKESTPSFLGQINMGFWLNRNRKK